VRPVDRKPIAVALAGDERWVFVYILCVLLISAGVGIAVGHVPGWMLGSALAVTLSLASYFMFLTPRRRQIRTYARWRDVMPCYLSVQDRDLRIIDTNDLFRREFGNRVGERCFEAYKNKDGRCPDCPVLMTFEDGQGHSGEETVVGKGGTIHHVVVTSAPLKDDHGDVVAVVEMSMDVTEITNLRRELDQSRRDYKELFGSVPCYICVLDRDLRISEANDLYVRGFGDVRGSLCYEACKGRDSPCNDCLVAKTFKDGRMHTSEETLTTRDGRQMNLVVHSMPVLDDTGEVRSVLEVFTDITEVKNLQRQLTLMGRAVTGMAHRIKNLLMGLEGGIFVVNTGMEDDDKDAVAQGWEMVERNVNRVTRMVKDLLYCSKERRPEFEEGVSPIEIARDVHDLYSTRISGEGIALNVEVEDDVPPGFYDPEGIHSLLSNLVSNAIDACRFDATEGKESHNITIRCLKGNADTTVFEVEDNGPGIPEEDVDRVFEDFFSTKGTEGTGVGLLVVQKIAQEHGGTVTFDSSPGEGTRFTVTIPPA